MHFCTLRQTSVQSEKKYGKSRVVRGRARKKRIRAALNISECLIWGCNLMTSLAMNFRFAFYAMKYKLCSKILFQLASKMHKNIFWLEHS